MQSKVNCGRPIFPGVNGVDQLVEIIKVLGTPSPADMTAVDPRYASFRTLNLPIRQPRPLSDIMPPQFRSKEHWPTLSRQMNFLRKTLTINPERRLCPFVGLTDEFFQPLFSDDSSSSSSSFAANHGKNVDRNHLVELGTEANNVSVPAEAFVFSKAEKRMAPGEVRQWMRAVREKAAKKGNKKGEAGH